jgi:hypothetical protein
MARKPALKTGFAPHEMSGFIEELTREATSGSERATILVASAHADELLRRRLYGLMVDKEAGAALLGDNATAPLGSFSARTQAAVALGAITSTEGKCLDMVRGIRNIYAHRLDHEIDKGSVKDRVLALCDLVEPLSDVEPIGRENPLQRVYAAAVLALMMGLMVRLMEEGRANTQKPDESAPDAPME